MTREYWNKYVAGRTFYARPVRDDEQRVWWIPTEHDDYKLTPDDLQYMGEVGFTMPLIAEDTDSHE